MRRPTNVPQPRFVVKTMYAPPNELDNAKVKMLKEQIQEHHKGVYGKAAESRKDLLGAKSFRWERGPYRNQWKFIKNHKDPKPFQKKGKQKQ
jgi:hypothetical protein